MMKLLKKLFRRSPIDHELIAENNRNEWKEICNVHSISYTDEFNMYTVIVADYAPGRFEEIQYKLEKRLSFDEHLYPINWNGDHLHFKIVQMQNKSVYLYAMLYFFEYTNPPKVLFVEKIEDDADEFLKQYGKIKRL